MNTILKRAALLIILFLLHTSLAFAQPGSVIAQQKISDLAGNFTGDLNDSDTFGNGVASLGDLDGDGIADLAVSASGDDDVGTDFGAVWILFMNADGTVKSQQKISATEGGFTGVLESGESFGRSVANLGDLDGDSVTDIAVGAATDNDGGTARGAVWILFLNIDGTVKAQQKISSSEGDFSGSLDDGDSFGTAVCGLNDFDGDGVRDLAVGAIGDDDGGTDRGAVWILFLHADARVKSQQKISATQGNFSGALADGDLFGFSIALMNDLDDDGVADLAIGAVGDDDGGEARGAVWVLFMQGDGTVNGEQEINATHGGFTGELSNLDFFGHAVSNVSDLNGDGVNDLAAGAIGDDDGGSERGAVWILFLNADATVKRHQKISAIEGGFSGSLDDEDAFGNALATVEDLNGDGIVDLAVGAFGDDDGGNFRGAVWTVFLEGVKPFVLLANQITLKRTKQSTSSGDIHSNGALTIEKGDPSTYNSNLSAVGKITINKQNTINGNVTSQTSISNSGVINGAKTIGAVASEPLPSLSYSAGGLNKTVPNGGSLTLVPGSYGIVTMSNNGTLKLTSGEYFMNELRYASTIAGGTIEIDLSSGALITINVVNNLQLGHEAAIVLLPNGESDSELVKFNTLQTTSANWGREAYLLGSFNAPSATVTLVKNTQLRGSMCANKIVVERDCLFLHHDSPGALPGPGNLPKAFFVDEEEAAGDQSSVTSYQLEQNYPNPFNPSTTISFALPTASDVTLSIYNTSGQLVKKLVAGEMNAGQHKLVWDATNERGERVASGVYLYVIKAGEFTAQKKLVLMK